MLHIKELTLTHAMCMCVCVFLNPYVVFHKAFKKILKALWSTLYYVIDL